MAVIIMGSVHGTCQRVIATPLMIDWIFNIGWYRIPGSIYICELVSWKWRSHCATPVVESAIFIQARGLVTRLDGVYMTLPLQAPFG